VTPEIRARRSERRPQDRRRFLRRLADSLSGARRWAYDCPSALKVELATQLDSAEHLLNALNRLEGEEEMDGLIDKGPDCLLARAAAGIRESAGITQQKGNNMSPDEYKLHLKLIAEVLVDTSSAAKGALKEPGRLLEGGQP
jgi:hypothetical protein